MPNIQKMVADHEAWKRTNPIRRFREDSVPRIPKTTLAAILGVSLTSLREWEFGRTMPDWPNTAKLARLMDLLTEKLREQLDRWERENPFKERA